MSRVLTLSALAVGAFGVTFGLVQILGRPAAPPGMVWVPGGEFTMGTNSEQGQPDEKPLQPSERQAWA